MKFRLSFLFIFLAAFYGCTTTQPIASETRELDSVPADSINFSSLTQPPQDWHHLDEDLTRFRGISSQLAYEELLKDRSPEQRVIVAVIDGGVDINHEDLKANIWTNEDEVPGNSVDDDENGYTDDVHGWNFIGGPDGKNVDIDTFEVTRLYAKLHPKYATADTSDLTPKEKKEYQLYKKVANEYRYQINKQLEQYNNLISLQQSMQQADRILSNYFNGSYNYEKVRELQPVDQQMAFAKNVMSYVMENDIDSTLIAEQKKQLYEFMKYSYNPDFSPRHIVGDDYENPTERFYGNPDVEGPDPSHGTHVAGIIGAVRNNGVGMNGIAGHVWIMPIRAVPNGDERDKDVANAIRYAVDNGARIINMSFGKSYSPYKAEVDKAVRYADEHGVLMVHAAGNSAENTDKKENYPTDTYGDYFKGTHSARLWLSVGASGWKPDSAFVGGFSNYGNQHVDLFAPGVDIYSTIPGDKYERNQGTSMAAPVVSGTAAVIMSYYPGLSAKQVRKIIMENVEMYPNQMVTLPQSGAGETKQVEFESLSVSDGEVNLYNALQAAKEMSNP